MGVFVLILLFFLKEYDFRSVDLMWSALVDGLHILIV